MAKPPSDQAEKIVVRLPDGMRDQLAVHAKINKRSVNAEVVARLEETFKGYVKAGDTVQDVLRRTIEMRDEINERLVGIDRAIDFLQNGPTEDVDLEPDP